MLSETILKQKKGAETNIDIDFSSCKLIHIQILRIIYSLEKPPIVFKQLYTSLKRFTSERTLRDKVADLRKLGLIDAIDSGVLLIFPIKDEERKKGIVQLLTNSSTSMGDVFR